MKGKLITIRPTNGADLVPGDRSRVFGTLHDVIGNRFLGAQPGKSSASRTTRTRTTTP